MLRTELRKACRSSVRDNRPFEPEGSGRDDREGGVGLVGERDVSGEGLGVAVELDALGARAASGSMTITPAAPSTMVMLERSSPRTW